MSSSTSSGRIARARRREDFWNQVTFLVGCAAVVGIVAAVVLVGGQQVMRSAPVVDEAFVRAEMKPPIAGRNWSGKEQTEPAQFEVMGSSATRPATGKDSPSPEATQLINQNAPARSVPKALPLVSGIEDLDGKRERVGEVVKAFFAAATIDAKLPYVRDSERVKPLMQDFYNREPMPAPPQWHSLGRVVRVDEPGFRLGYVQALFDNAPAVTVIIEEQDNGSFRVDWECFVRYGEMSWSDFISQRSTEPKLLRVKASRPVSPPPAQPADGGMVEWLELRHSLQSGTILASFRRDDPQLESLITQLDQGKWTDVPVTVRVCFPTNASNSYAAVTAVEGKGWLILGNK